MDSLTHTVLGACAGELIAGKRIGKKALVLGALVANLPDIDVVSGWWMNEADSLIAHRGITHSILFCFVFSMLLTFIFFKWSKKDNMSVYRWFALFSFGLFSHIFIDALTGYGTGWLEPFSQQRISFNTIFVVDPLYTVVLLIATLALLLKKSEASGRKQWALFGIICSTFYLSLTFLNKTIVDKAAKHSLNRQHLNTQTYFTTPTPFNNFLWMIVQEDSSSFHIGYYSLFDKNADIQYQQYIQSDSIIQIIKDNQEFKTLKQFSEGYFLITSISDTIYFHDLRFGQIGGWNGPEAPFVFKYSLKPGSFKHSAFMGGRLNASAYEALNNMFIRMKGK